MSYFVKCEVCKENSTSEKQCMHINDGYLDKQDQVSTQIPVKPKVEEISFKELDYIDTPEYLPINIFRSEARKEAIEDEESEDINFVSIKEELSDEVSSDTAIQTEDSLDVKQDNEPEEVSFYCKLCSKSFGKIVSFERHQRIHTGEKPFAHKSCEKRFKDLASLDNTKKRSFPCRFCSRTFTEHLQLVLHKQMHTREKPYRCDICQRKFSFRRYLNKHKKLHEREIKCAMCSTFFSSKAGLEAHQMVHAEEKPFTCEQCGSSFNRIDLLRDHVISHKGDKPYNCRVCLKWFISSSVLKKHMLIHAGEKPYSCSICSQSFTRHSSLVCHENSHREKKSYDCEICSKSFLTKTGLGRHETLHHRKIVAQSAA